MMKRIVVITVLLVISVGIVFGGGEVEEVKIKEPDKGFIFKIYPSFGELHIQISPKREVNKIKAWAVRIDDNINSDENVLEYFSSPFYNNDNNTSDETKINTIINNRPNDLTESIYIENYDMTIEKFSLQNITFDQNSETEFNAINEVTLCKIKMDDFGKEIRIEAVFIYEKNKDNKIQCMYANVIFTPEFFKGERELFKTAGGTYEEKCHSFIKTFFIQNNAKSPQYKTSLEKIFGTIEDKDPIALEYNGNEATYHSAFKKALSTHFICNYEKKIFNDEQIGFEMPYLYFGNYSVYPFLYKNEEDYYILTYLRYLFEIKKPVLANFITRKLKAGNINNKPALYYQNSKYTEIKEAESVDLAKLALRYLTWGVEYTPYPGINSINMGISGNAVFFEFSDEIIKWVMNNNFLASRFNNYLAGGPKKADTWIIKEEAQPNQVQIFEGDFATNRLKVVGRMNNDEDMRIAMIHFWTSRNIIWDEGRAVSFYKVIDSNSQEIERSTSLKISDKNIKKGTGSYNLHITRSNINDEIHVGYEFAERENIGAICIVRGAAAVPKKSKFARNMIEILYKQNGNWNNIKDNEDIKVIEYVIRQNKKDVYWYTRDFKLEVDGYKISGKTISAKNTPDWGYGIYTNKYEKEPAQDIYYSYFLFNKIYENWEGIKIVDKTGNDYLNITEFMVFPENPIDYTPKDRYQNLRIGTIETLNGLTMEPELLYNCNPNHSLLIPESTDPAKQGVSWFNVDFTETVNVKTIAVYEENAYAITLSDIFKEYFMVLFGSSDLGDAIYYSDLASIVNLFMLHEDITTPFFKGNKSKTGNPIPYVPGGIDSPRTFNYKMYQQKLAREWGRDNDPLLSRKYTAQDTTHGKDGWGFVDYKNGYIDEIDIFKTALNDLLRLDSDFTYMDYNMSELPKNSEGMVIKPFLPGLYLNTEKGYAETHESPYYPDKTAGVDSIGMLMGIVSMNESIIRDIKLMSIFNTDVGEEVNKYYHMDSTIPGVDTKKKPIFYANEVNSIVKGNYRFTKSDFEKSTIIVPDFEEVRAGDLVINLDVDKEPHIGIIVLIGTPEQGEDPRNKIYVVSIRRGFRMTLLGTWGNPNGMFGGFTTEPDKYHVRRLLKLNGSQNKYDEEQKWDAIKEYIDELNVYVELPDDEYTDGQKNHWIPNTNEYFKEIEITIKGIRGLTEMDLPVYTRDIKIISPRDQFYEKGYDLEGKTEGGPNLYCNKGEGLIFAAIKDPDGNPTPLILAEMKRNKNPEGKKLNDNTYYDVELKEYFDSSGKGINDHRLYIGDDNKLYFEKTGDNGFKTSKFAVKALDTVRPGDDFLLRFALVDEPDITGTSFERDFMAVYDKKLLWRANLYIDERYKWKEQIKETTQQAGESEEEYNERLDKYDWNNVNPWDDNSNEWKRILNYENNPLDPGGEYKDYYGKQVNLLPWTHPETTYIHNGESQSVKNRGDKNGTVWGAVPYSWGYQLYTIQSDDFNVILNKISDQNDRTYFEDSYYKDGESYKLMDDRKNDTDNKKRKKIINDNGIENIIRHEPNDTIPSFLDKMSQQANESQKHPNKETIHPCMAPKNDKGENDWDEYSSDSYIPTLGYYNCKKPDEQKEGKPTGLHCTNLVYRSMKYSGNNYRREWYTYWVADERRDCEFINSEGEKYYRTLIGDMRLIVPGDIVTMHNHWAIVLSIEYEPNARETSISQVRFIHATPWGEYWYVQNRHYLADFLKSIGTCTLGRLQTK